MPVFTKLKLFGVLSAMYPNEAYETPRNVPVVSINSSVPPTVEATLPFECVITGAPEINPVPVFLVAILVGSIPVFLLS